MAELFNPRTIQRLTSKIKVSPKQKESADLWLKLLDEGKLKDETVNYFRFGEIVLKDMLGYDITDMDFEDGNIEFSFKNKYGYRVLGIEAKGNKG